MKTKKRELSIQGDTEKEIVDKMCHLQLPQVGD